MIDWINFAVALSGSLVAGVVDLKTSDIPEEIPYMMTAWAVFSWFVASLETSTPYPLLHSIITGIVFFAMGYALYFSGAWGEGDAVLLGSIGALLPVLNGVSIYPLVFLFSFAFGGGLYVLAYSIALASYHPEVWAEFLKKLRSVKEILVTGSILAFFIGSLADASIGITLGLAVAGSAMAWSLGKAIEDSVFVREIPASELKEGDVLANSDRIVGITKEQADKLRRKGGTIKIKEGIRLGLAFPVALLFSLLFV